ncbi:MAG: iron-containing alcohol dehydrogenase, partial [Pseudomonadota bacterium]
LAYNGMEMIKEGLHATYQNGQDLKARSRMAYAAMLSGITLANAGLGTVHGLAAELGGVSSISHSVACGTLLGSITEATINRLWRAVGVFEHETVKKYARIGVLFSGEDLKDIEKNSQNLILTLHRWVEELNMPRLASFGITRDSLEKIATKCPNKNNPIPLNKDQINAALQERY